MNREKGLSAIIFDMDGLMLDTERVALLSWQKAAQTYGYDLSKSTIIKTIGRDVNDTQCIFQKALGAGFDFQQARALRLRYTTEHIKEEGLPLKAGLLELLDMLEAWSVPKGVATSTEKSHAIELLTTANLIDRFEALTCGDEVPHSKPEPDIFLLAASRLNVAPQACLVLEDSESGIRAASRAGMKSLIIPDLKQPSAEIVALADNVFPNLHEAAAYLAPLLERD